MSGFQMSLTPRQFALQVTEKLQQAGFEALWAGGCVRDQLLGKSPKDYDIATDATPGQIRQLFGRRGTIAVGAAFGVITVIGPPSAGNIEVATFRCDSGYSDGRRPDSVTFSTAELDAHRRDFTINGLFLDPLRDQVIDYVGGKADLKSGVVRAIGNPAERIAEDKLRMLRAVRFAANLGFRLDADTAQTIERHAREISIVSPERISAELERMLTHANRRRAVELLVETGLMSEIFPESGGWIEDSESRNATLLRLELLDHPRLEVALATLLDNIVGPQAYAETCRQLRLPNAIAENGVWMYRVANTLRHARQLPWSEVQPVLVDPRIELALEFVTADLTATGADHNGPEFCRERLQWPASKLDPPALINGDILLENRFQPGPGFSTILRESRRAQLDGEIETAEQALDLARRLAAGNPTDD